MPCHQDSSSHKESHNGVVPLYHKALNSYSATKLIQLGQEYIQLQHQAVRVIFSPPFAKSHSISTSFLVLSLF